MVDCEWPRCSARRLLSVPGYCIRYLHSGRKVIVIVSIPISSKHPSRRSKNEFYRYYAGYPVEFAEWALGELNLSPGALVIDPWNGSGTTAVACARVGISCKGFDINPVMVHLGRARVASNIDFEEAEELVSAVDTSIGQRVIVDLSVVGSAFREFPVSNESARSVAISALFPYARKLLSLSKTKNPSWFKKGTSLNGSNLEKCDFFTLWRSLLLDLRLWRSTQEEFYGVTISIERGDSRKSLGRKDAFDGVLTSPPYLTRLDYVQATLPELLLLREFDTAPNMQRLRRSMLGSPLTSERPEQALDRLPFEIRILLNKIKDHPSKASSTYYHRFFSTYFVDLQLSMRNIYKVLKDGASCCMVVQSSHYKEIEIDLVGSLISLAREVGFQFHARYEFDSRRSMSLVNTRAHEQGRKPKSEFAVMLRRE